jgi:hypothetical protein
MDEEAENELEGLREHGRAVRDAAGGLADASQHALDDVERLTREVVRSHPHFSLGAAFAVGWILARGVPAGLVGLASGPLGQAMLGMATLRLAGREARSREGREAEERRAHH